jgi:ribosome-binding factor A
VTQEPQRKRRIEAEIQRVLSELIAREVKDPRVGSVTITAVSMAADMGAARVYFTPFASKMPPEEVRIGLTHAGGFLRGEVGRRLRLRHAPRLEFLFDDTVDRAARLTGLIDSAVKHDQAGHVDEDVSEAAGRELGSGDGAANDESV